MELDRAQSERYHMALGTFNRQQAETNLRRWAERQILEGRPFDNHFEADFGPDLGYWMVDYRYKGHPVYVTENGLLVVWSKYRSWLHSEGQGFSHVSHHDD